MEELRLFVRELKMQEKLSPVRNPQVAWFYCFFPALIGYFLMMANHLNAKPIVGGLDVAYPTAFHKVIPKTAKLEVVAQDMQWAEGPLWVEDSAAGIGYLLFSDTVENKIYKWESGKGMFTVGKSLYLEQSGCFKGNAQCDGRREVGSNGLLRQNHKDGVTDPAEVDLVACQHGDRAVSLLMANGTRVWIATHHEGRRLNSPNDLVRSWDGHIYFTDPDYGLLQKDSGSVDKDEKGDVALNGVYMVRREDLIRSSLTGRPTTKVVLLEGGLSKPNGLVFSPDWGKLYVSNSDSANPVIYEYEVLDDGKLKLPGKVFFDASSLVAAGSTGNLDGMTIDIFGNVIAAGPGGVLVLSPQGNLLGRMLVGDGRVATNVAFGDYGRLYITAGDVVLRTSISTRPAVKTE